MPLNHKTPVCDQNRSLKHTDGNIKNQSKREKLTLLPAIHHTVCTVKVFTPLSADHVC